MRHAFGQLLLKTLSAKDQDDKENQNKGGASYDTQAIYPGIHPSDDCVWRHDIFRNGARGL
jgi:hypothetical protein